MDIRHPILTLGATKSGYQMFYSSPRNRPDVQVALLEKLECNVLFTPDVMSEATKAVLERRQMKKCILPELEYFLSEEPAVPPYPYTKTFDEARKDPYVVLHSSGTTGTPKILVMKNGGAAAHDAFHLLPQYGEAPWTVGSWAGKRVLTNFPWVHAGGALILSSSIFVDFVPVIPASWPLKGADADYLHVHGNVQAVWYSPAPLIDIARNPDYVKNLAKLDAVAYAGGILPSTVGNAIAQHTRVYGTMASTETGILPSEAPPSDMWNYYKFPKQLGHELRPYADDMCELVMHRNGDWDRFQGVFYTFLTDQTYDMRDLYIEHPTAKGWWRSSGRIDDVVIMNDAKKINAVPYEAVIEQHPDIAVALICGSGRSRPAVLIQPTKWMEETEESSFIDRIWPQIEKANHAGPVYGRLIKDLVVIVRSTKPMERAGGKDTIQRKRSLDNYHEEIDAAYERAEKLGILYGDVADKGGLI